MASTRSPETPRPEAAAARNDDRGVPAPHGDGRSAERARQDHAIGQTAHKESWITQLLRTFKFSKGRPKPGDRKTNI